MSSSEFSRQRSIIEHASKRGHKWRKRAMAKLMRDAGVEEIKSGSRVIGYRKPNGRTICAKQRYATEDSALDALMAIQREQDTRKKPIRCYLCEWCSGWHLTSKELCER